MIFKNEKFNDKAKFCIESFAIVFALFFVGYFLRLWFFDLISPAMYNNDAFAAIASYAGHIFFLIVFFAYSFFIKSDRKFILSFCDCRLKRKLLSFVIGIAIGFLLNVFCVFLAYQNNDISIEFLTSPSIWFFILALIAVFVQSATEEIQYRGLLFGRLRGNKVSVGIAIFVSSVAFSLTHFLNPGFGPLEFFNIFTIGIFLALLYCVTGSIWSSFGFHMAWNYTQDFIFGLANSGNESLLSLSTTKIYKSSFFFNADFGIEGSLMCAVVNIVGSAILFVIFYMQKKNKKSTLSK